MIRGAMPVSDQGIKQERYTLIPRTAIFLRRGDSYLLLRGSASKRLWAGKYNCLGGHIERGEDVRSSASRELLEESGLEADLWLCGTVVIDAGERGGRPVRLHRREPWRRAAAVQRGRALMDRI